MPEQDRPVAEQNLQRGQLVYVGWTMT